VFKMGESLGPVNIHDIAISPKYRKHHWQMALNDDDWETMVAIFKDRLEGRFLKPIRLIENDTENGEFSGFSILALDCLIIETLHQFYEGINETKRYKNEEAFCNFFNDSEYFRDYFDTDSASTFYKHYRCGLLHQAQTKGKSIIRIDQDTMVKAINKSEKLIGLIINRLLFHKALEDEINAYLSKLISGGDENSTLRKNFIKKMNFICGS
jgi:hypothetical protein